MIDEHELQKAVRRSLSADEVAHCQAFWDTLVKNEGDTVRVGLRKVPMPFDGTFVFVDMMPGANWGHSVAYLLMNRDFSKCVRHDGQFPPFSGDLPDHWRPIPLSA